MAFVSTKSQIKNNILNYVRNLLPKTLYRCIEILFKPCCDIQIVSAKAVCSATPGTYDLTIELNQITNTLGRGLMLVLVDGVTGTINTNPLIPYNDSKIITIEGLDIGGVAGGTFGLSVLFLLPTSQNLNPSIITNLNELTPGTFFFATSEEDTVFPACI